MLAGYSSIRLNELDKEDLEAFLELEHECLKLAYSPKPWLTENPGYSWVKAKWESEEASNYYLLYSNGSLRGYVYMDPGDGTVYSYICPHIRPSLRDNTFLLLRFLREQCIWFQAVKTIIWLGLEHSRLHRAVTDLVGSPYYYTWYYRMYYKIREHRLNYSGKNKYSNYRIVFGGLELAGEFLEIIHDAFGEELEWFNRKELEKWFKETHGEIILVYLGGEPVGAGYFHYNTSLTGENLVGYIPLLGVKRCSQGRGIGKTLVYSIIERLMEREVEYIVVDCLEELVEYYSRLGFGSAGRIISLNITPTLI